MTDTTRGVVLLALALAAVLFGMTIAAYSSPLPKPLPHRVSLSGSLSHGALSLSSQTGQSFASVFTSPNTLSRAFTPGSEAISNNSNILPHPVLANSKASEDVTRSESTHIPKVRLTQIPYTGFDFGPLGNSIYWLALGLFAFSLAYLIVYSQTGFFGSIQNLLRSTALRIDSIRGV